jgi:hypothetical protein
MMEKEEGEILKTYTTQSQAILMLSSMQMQIPM